MELTIINLKIYIISWQRKEDLLMTLTRMIGNIIKMVLEIVSSEIKTDKL